MVLKFKTVESDTESNVAQWKRAGLITRRAVDRNNALLIIFIFLLSFIIVSR
jgi:hypothetical protein